MKKIIKLLALSLLIQISFSCEKKGELKSDKAELFILDLEINATVYGTIISGNNITLIKDLPYGSSEMKVKTLSISEGAISSISVGDIMHVSNTGIDISITAQNEVVKKKFHLSFSITPSDQAEISLLNLENNSSTYNTTISGTDLSLVGVLPYATSKVKVKTLIISASATSSISAGDLITVSTAGIDITVTAQNKVVKKVYHLSLPVAEPSNQAKILDLAISLNGAVYHPEISSLNLTFSREFPYYTSGKLTINSFSISENAHANIVVGQKIDVNNVIPITVMAEDGITSNTYSLAINIDTDGKLLITQSSYSSCIKYTTYRFSELMLENNMWNADNLPVGSFSQCIYQVQKDAGSLFGWKWSFAQNQHGVNAYPEIIYGLKPWYSWNPSTTPNLPKKIRDISRLKVTYDAELYVDDGEYNLAFDNWICSSSGAAPESILFEFMIWEDSRNMGAPFGDYLGDVTTANGVYKFYKGEPTWEPAGCNWTYIAFARVEKRNSGKVDVDELLDYLVNKGILRSDSYLSSIEMGNEVGNSKGYTVFKKFAVEIE